MRKTLAALVLALAASSAQAQGVQSSVITTTRISKGSPARYVTLQTANSTAAASGLVVRLFWPFATTARLVDVIVWQNTAGTGGTSVAFDVKNAAGTSLLSTLPVATLASGGGQITDAAGDLALPAGWTRPVVSPSALVTKGAIQISTTETGTYSPHPTFTITLVFEPVL